MFHGHTIRLVTDLHQIGSMMYDTNINTIVAVSDDYGSIESRNIYTAPVLIPPFNMLMDYTDGKIDLNRAYSDYLNNYPLCNDVIITILAVLVKRDVLLYISNNDMNLYGNILLGYISNKYGINVGTPYIPFGFSDRYKPYILSCFFMQNIMDADDFLATYPGNMKLLDFTIQKLINDLKPFGNNPNVPFGQYVEYFNRKNAEKLNSNNNINIDSNGNNIMMVRRVR